MLLSQNLVTTMPILLPANAFQVITNQGAVPFNATVKNKPYPILQLVAFLRVWASFQNYKCRPKLKSDWKIQSPILCDLFFKCLFFTWIFYCTEKFQDKKKHWWMLQQGTETAFQSYFSNWLSHCHYKSCAK